MLFEITFDRFVSLNWDESGEPSLEGDVQEVPRENSAEDRLLELLKPPTNKTFVMKRKRKALATIPSENIVKAFQSDIEDRSKNATPSERNLAKRKSNPKETRTSSEEFFSTQGDTYTSPEQLNESSDSVKTEKKVIHYKRRYSGGKEQTRSSLSIEELESMANEIEDVDGSTKKTETNSSGSVFIPISIAAKLGNQSDMKRMATVIHSSKSLKITYGSK